MSQPAIQFYDHNNRPIASAGGYEGAGDGMAGQVRNWAPTPRTVDAALLPSLDLGNARAEDVVRNNAFASNAVQLHIDNIVGDLFRLSYKPNWKRLGISEDEARAFARDVEALWVEHSEDPGCFLDAERKRTFTMMIREGVGTHTRLGEIMRVPIWTNSFDSPIRTAIKTINPQRVSNPNGTVDTTRIKGGVEQNRHGAALAYHLRNASEYGLGDGLGYKWERIPRFTRWGRPRFIHIFEPMGEGQTRGANQFLSVLEQMQILPKMQKTKLQNAVVNAMFAATIESDLESKDVFEMLGGKDNKQLLNFLSKQVDYHDNVNLKLGGVSVPHLLPSEKLNLHTSGNVDNGYVELESSILRWLAAGTNTSYEELSRDYKQSSYSSARASMLVSWRYFKGRRKIIASRDATMIFRLWFEEVVLNGMIRLPRGAKLDLYDGLAAWTNCAWIGTGRMAIDGVKEVKEAILRIEAGLSTYEKELANMGEDYQEIFAQQVRETKERADAGLPLPSWAKAEAFAPPEQPKEA